jgi:hypothetical protein
MRDHQEDDDDDDDDYSSPLVHPSEDGPLCRKFVNVRNGIVVYIRQDEIGIGGSNNDVETARPPMWKLARGDKEEQKRRQAKNSATQARKEAQEAREKAGREETVSKRFAKKKQAPASLSTTASQKRRTGMMPNLPNRRGMVRTGSQPSNKECSHDS